jgi:hypothetical protein
VVHCLVEAPNAEGAAAGHVETAGSAADEIYEVEERS